jgi:hypothetical protein
MWGIFRARESKFDVFRGNLISLSRLCFSTGGPRLNLCLSVSFPPPTVVICEYILHIYTLYTYIYA